jgi:RNA polymerase sigma-70 factor (ECF subfamily)
VRRQVAADTDRMEDPAPGAEEAPGADDRLLDEERRDMVREAIQGLPDRQRETVRLRLEGDRDYARIAEEMGVSVGTVKANYHHAVRNLRKALAAGAGAGGTEDETP